MFRNIPAYNESMLTPNLLIIEDHEGFRKAVRHFLELHRIRVKMMEASSGEEAVLLARKEKPHIVIADFSLGGINGLVASRKIKERLPQCSIVMLTIHDAREIFRRDRQRIISFSISKSDPYEQLVRIINRILRGSHINRRTAIKRGKGN